MEAVKTILSNDLYIRFAKQNGNHIRAFSKKHRISTAVVSKGKIMMVQPYSLSSNSITQHEPFTSLMDWIEYLQNTFDKSVDELVLDGSWNGIANTTVRLFLTGSRAGEMVSVKAQKEMMDLRQGNPSLLIPPPLPTDFVPPLPRVPPPSLPTDFVPPLPRDPPPPLDKKDQALNILRRAVTAAPFVPQFPPLPPLPLEKIKETVIEPPLPAPRIEAPRKKPIMNPEEEDWDEDEEDAQPTPTPSEHLAIEVKVAARIEREKKIQKFMDIIQSGLRELLSETA